MRASILLAVCAGVGLGVACGGGTPAPSTPAPSTPAAATDSVASTDSASATPTASAAPAASSAAPEADKVVGPPEVKWADMDTKQRGKFMAAVVMPKMKELFAEFDPKAFGTFTCGTCHGKDAKERAFKMPNPALFVLPSAPAEFGKLMKDKPNWVKFMGEKVKPEMAKLLGKEPFDMKNPKPGQFGCAECHTMKAK